MSHKGFTLVEILIAMAVISVILSLSFVSAEFLIRRLKFSEAENLKENFSAAFNYALLANKPVLVSINFSQKSFSFYLNDENKIVLNNLKELTVLEKDGRELEYYITPYEFLLPLRAVFKNGAVFEITPLGEMSVK